jgi:hypothetical protein
VCRYGDDRTLRERQVGVADRACGKATQPGTKQPNEEPQWTAMTGRIHHDLMCRSRSTRRCHGDLPGAWTHLWERQALGPVTFAPHAPGPTSLVATLWRGHGDGMNAQFGLGVPSQEFRAVTGDLGPSLGSHTGA